MIKSTEAAAALREKLQQGETNFVFKKKDGSRRKAKGTTNLDLVPKDLHPKDMDENYEGKPKNDALVTYFDLEKMSWRSCRVENILEIEGKEVEV